jgi:hypothetical protein
MHTDSVKEKDGKERKTSSKEYIHVLTDDGGWEMEWTDGGRRQNHTT